MTELLSTAALASTYNSALAVTRKNLGAAVEHIYDHVVPHERNNFRPYVLRHRSLWLLSALLVMVKVAAIVLLSFAPPLPAYSSAITSENILSLTNQSRGDYNAPALTLNSQLAKAAQAKADDMVAKQYFSHESPDGRSPWDFITAAGYKYQAAGENLAVNFLQAEEVETAWMNSPGHRANLLNPAFKEVGIGIASGNLQGNSVIFVVQEFGAAAAQINTATAPKAQPAPKPAPAPAPVAAAPAKPKATPAPKPAAPVTKPKPAPAPAATKPQPVAKATPQPTPAPAAPTPMEIKPSIVSVPFKISIRGLATTFAPAQPTLPATLPTSPATAPATTAITSASAELASNELKVMVETSGPTKSVAASVGNKSFPLTLSNNIWQGIIPLAQLAGTTIVTIQAVDTSGNTTLRQLADFANSIQQNYNALSQNTNSEVNFFGIHVNASQFQQVFYSMFIAAILFALMVAIAVRPRMQYLSMVTHTSVVILLATLLWRSI